MCEICKVRLIHIEVFMEANAIASYGVLDRPGCECVVRTGEGLEKDKLCV
jgi:hypothetical protein